MEEIKVINNENEEQTPVPYAGIGCGAACQAGFLCPGGFFCN